MKFTDGYWLTKEGYTAHHVSQAYNVFENNGELVIYGTIKRVNIRGDILNSPLITLIVSSPAPEIVKIRIDHFKGENAKQPSFELESFAPYRPEIEINETGAALKTGSLTVRVSNPETPWKLSFESQGKLLTASENKSVAWIQYQEQSWIKEELDLDIGEFIYGLGERFAPFVKNGQSIDIWNKDGGTASEQAYKNIPIYLSSKGYGVFVNHPELVSFEVGSEKVSKVQFSVSGQGLEYYLINGPTPKDVLTRYTSLTGRAPLPPLWSFGLWLTTSFTTSYDEKTVTSFIQGMEDRKLPLSVFHFDCFWMKEFQWCDFQWDSKTFPDPAGMLKRLKARGLKICVWINSYIAQQSVLFEEGKAKGYLLKKKNGDVWQTDLWQAGMGIVDFTNPEACKWYTSKLEILLDQGVDCFKTDFGERIPTDVVWYDGSNPEGMHNYYTYKYNKTVYDLLKRKKGEAEAVLFARSATAGGQKFPVHWGGDCESTFASMAESLRGGLSLGLSGFAYWSHDIAGFEGSSPEALYKRWSAFGLFSSHSRLHGSTAYKVPWLYGEESVEVLRFFTNLRLKMMPYLYTSARDSSQTGVPMLRAMFLDYPEDPTCLWLDRQYMLGNDLLVAPVFSEEGEVSYYLPQGRWTNIISGKELVGPGWQKENHDFFSLPLMARPGSLIPFGNRDDVPDYDWKEETTFRLYALDAGQEALAVVADGKGKDLGSVKVQRQSNAYTVKVQGKLSKVKLLFVLPAGLNSQKLPIKDLKNGTAKTVEQGIEISLSSSEASFSF